MTKPSALNPVARGAAGLVRLEDDAGPWLRHFIANFPRETNRALGSVGFYLRRQAVAAVKRGGVHGEWEERSVVQRAGLLRGVGKVKKLKRGKRKGYYSQRYNAPLEARGSLESMAEASRFGASPWAFGKAQAAIRYKLDAANKRVTMGWISPSAARYGAAVQAGLRGAPGRMHRRRQFVSPRMRRAFAAAGVVLSADTTHLESEPRPLMQPLLQAEDRQVLKVLEDRLVRAMRKRPPRGFAAGVGRGGRW